MSKMMNYKGYHATFEYDNEDKIFIGHVHGLSDSLFFHGSSVEQLEKMFHQSIDNYLDFCKSIGKTPDKEYSGAFNIRISSETHRQLADEALSNGKTINAIINDAIEMYLNNGYTSNNTIILCADLNPKPISKNISHSNIYSDNSVYRTEKVVLGC